MLVRQPNRNLSAQDHSPKRGVTSGFPGVSVEVHQYLRTRGISRKGGGATVPSAGSPGEGASRRSPIRQPTVPPAAGQRDPPVHRGGGPSVDIVAKGRN